jgi:hypothetical protein
MRINIEVNRYRIWVEIPSIIDYRGQIVVQRFDLRDSAQDMSLTSVLSFKYVPVLSHMLLEFGLSVEMHLLN